MVCMKYTYVHGTHNTITWTKELETNYTINQIFYCVGITMDFVIVTQSGSFFFKHLLQSHFSVDGDSVIFKQDKWNYSWQWSHDTISSPAVSGNLHIQNTWRFCTWLILFAGCWVCSVGKCYYICFQDFDKVLTKCILIKNHSCRVSIKQKTSYCCNYKQATINQLLCLGHVSNYTDMRIAVVHHKGDKCSPSYVL